MRIAVRLLPGLLLALAAAALAQPAPGPDAADAAARCEQQHAGQDRALANCLARAGEALARADRQAEALALHRRALALREAALGAQHPDVGASLTAAAGALGRLRRHAEALEAAERAVALLQAAPGASAGRLVNALTMQAALLRQLGRYPEALEAYGRAIGTAETRLGADSPLLVGPLRLLASLQRELGRPEQVLPLYERALAILEKQPRPDSAELAIVLRQIGSTHRRAGREEQALPTLERALALQEQRLGPQHPSLLDTVVDLGLAQQRLGRLDAAQAQKQRAAAGVDTLLAAGRTDIADLLHDLALLAGRLGDAPLELRLLQQGLLLTEVDDPELQWRLHGGLMRASQAAGRTDEAIVWGKQAVVALQGLRAAVVPLGRAAQVRFVDSPKRQVYQRLAELLIGAGRLPEAQQALQLLKEDELDEGALRGAPAPGTALPLTGLEQERFGSFYTLREQQLVLYRERRTLEQQRRAGGLSASAAARLAEIERQALPQIGAALQRFFATLQPQLDQAQRAGAERRDVRLTETLLRRAVIAAAQRPGDGAVALQYLVGEDRLSILLTVPDGPPLARQVAIDAASLRRQVAAFTLLLKNPASDPARVRAAAQALHALLIAPVRSDLQAAGARTLMLSLTDVLRYLPFAALHDGRRWLLQDHALALFNEAGGQPFDTREAARWHVAGMGLSQPVDELRALPAVPEELAAVVGQLGGRSWLDARFTRQALLDALAAEYNVLHLASHFVFQAGDPAASRLYLGDRSRLTLADITSLDLRFDRFELVTLSACDTAQADGRDAYGQEIESLGAKAQAQGARAVLATLWKVSDRSTGALMRQFYRARDEAGTNKAEALRQAQLALLEGTLRPESGTPWTHPFHWAPFVLMGDWR